MKHFLKNIFHVRREEIQVADQERSMDLTSKESEVSSSSIVDTTEQEEDHKSEDNNETEEEKVREKPLDCSVSPPASVPLNNNNAGLESLQEAVAKVRDIFKVFK